MASALGSLQLSGCRSFSSPGGAIQPAMPRMSSDELLLRRFGQPRQASQPKEEEEEEEPGLDAQSARFGAYGTHKQASQQKRRRRRRSRSSMHRACGSELMGRTNKPASRRGGGGGVGARCTERVVRSTSERPECEIPECSPWRAHGPASPGGAIQPAMPRMSSDELLLRRFGQPRQASQPKEEEEEEEPGLDAQSARFGAYGTHKQASQQKRRRRSRGSMLQILSNSLETHRECYRSFQIH